MKIINLLLLISISVSTYAQAISIISGTTRDNISGKVYMVGISLAKKYYGENSILDSADIKDGKFFFKRKNFDNNVYPYRLVFRNKQINETTDFLFVSNENSIVVIDTINSYQAPQILNSRIQYEMKFKYNSFFKSFVSKIYRQTEYEDSLDLVYNYNLPNILKSKLDSLRMYISLESDSLIYQYSKNNPNSYVTLWKLIERFYELGFKEIYLNIYNLLNIKIKSSSLGKLFYSDLINSKMLKLDKIFPSLEFYNIHGKKQIFNTLSLKKDFTLVDFWFSNCSPCLKEFPSYIKIYKAYHKDEFEIVGISVDSKKYIYEWRETITDKKLTWTQFLDPNGTVSSKYNINNFPTNFLLDKQGKIIKINITSIELNTFLKENLIVRDINDNIPKLEPE